MKAFSILLTLASTLRRDLVAAPARGADDLVAALSKARAKERELSGLYPADSPILRDQRSYVRTLQRMLSARRGA